MLSTFSAVMTPDWSLYTDWPVAIQIYNSYRRHYVGKKLQTLGVKVYPTISWSDEKSYSWCFDGDPVNGTVAISSVGTLRRKGERELFLEGYKRMMEALKPTTILFYGDVPDECWGNIVRIEQFHNKFGKGGKEGE